MPMVAFRFGKAVGRMLLWLIPSLTKLPVNKIPTLTILLPNILSNLVIERHPLGAQLGFSSLPLWRQLPAFNHLHWTSRLSQYPTLWTPKRSGIVVSTVPTTGNQNTNNSDLLRMRWLPNIDGRSRGSCTRWGFGQCNVAICKKGNCWGL